MCETKMVVVHKWEDRGIGNAPFRLVGFIGMPNAESFGTNFSGFQNAMQSAQHDAKMFGVSLGSCDVCGTGIHNHYVIQDANGKRFVVGCDCVAKTDDSKLITAVEINARIRTKAKNQAICDAKYEATRQARIEAESNERQANGGKTLREIAEQKRQEEFKALQDKHMQENWWLIEVIQGMNGEFCQNVSDELCKSSLASFSPRQISILRDIYAKTFGRSGSKKYDAGYDEFNSHLPTEQE